MKPHEGHNAGDPPDLRQALHDLGPVGASLGYPDWSDLVDGSSVIVQRSVREDRKYEEEVQLLEDLHGLLDEGREAFGLPRNGRALRRIGSPFCAVHGDWA